MSLLPVSSSCALVMLKAITRVVLYSIFSVMLLLNVMFSPSSGEKLSLMEMLLMSYAELGW